MQAKDQAAFRDGLVAAFPIVLGYLPITFSFGVAATQSGLSAVEAVAPPVARCGRGRDRDGCGDIGHVADSRDPCRDDLRRAHWLGAEVRVNPDLMIIAVLAGAANWAFRFLPTKLDPSGGQPDSPLSRFLASTGPAAICTLFVASVLPSVMALPIDASAFVAGVFGVCATFVFLRSVAGATFAGAAVYALVLWAMA